MQRASEDNELSLFWDVIAGLCEWVQQARVRMCVRS